MKYVKLLSSSAFNFNVCHYTVGAEAEALLGTSPFLAVYILSSAAGRAHSPGCPTEGPRYTST
jgi:hypothetical protein